MAEEQEEKVVKTTKKKVSKIPKKKYPLIKDVPFHDGVKKAGETVELSEKGYQYFKKLKRVK